MTGRRPVTADRHPWFARLYSLQRAWEPLGLARHRRVVAGAARGRILEVGAGTGFSVPYYREPPFALSDPSLAMARRTRARLERAGIKASVVVAAGEALPFADASFDTVVSCVTFCSVEDPATVAREIGRVLVPEGEYRFVEHGTATWRPLMARWQRLIAPVWARIFGGCRLDRDPIAPMLDAGLLPTKLRACSGGSVRRGTFHAGPEGVRAYEARRDRRG